MYFQGPFRKAKKSCDQQLPACGRCARLGKACRGYRDLSSLIFKDETPNFVRRISSHSDKSQSGGSSAALTRQPSPDIETVAKQFFFEQFVTPNYLAFLDGVEPDDFLMKPIMACALAAIANRNDDAHGRERARRCYVDAITATQAALRDPDKVREDNTLVSVCLLSIYEVPSPRLSYWMKDCTDKLAAYYVGAQNFYDLLETPRRRLCTSPPAPRPMPDSHESWVCTLQRTS